MIVRIKVFNRQFLIPHVTALKILPLLPRRVCPFLHWTLTHSDKWVKTMVVQLVHAPTDSNASFAFMACVSRRQWRDQRDYLLVSAQTQTLSELMRGQSRADETDLSGQMPNHEVPAYNRSSVYKVEHILSHTVCQRGQMGEKQPRPMWRVPLWDMTWVPCGPCGTWPGTLWCGLRGARHDQTDYRSCTMPSYVGAVCVQRGRVEGSHCLAEGTLNR